MGSEVKNNWMLFLTSETEQSKESAESQCIETKVIDYATLEGNEKSRRSTSSLYFKPSRLVYLWQAHALVPFFVVGDYDVVKLSHLNVYKFVIS